jgi:hypothetical protein
MNEISMSGTSNMIVWNQDKHTYSNLVRYMAQLQAIYLIFNII